MTLVIKTKPLVYIDHTVVKISNKINKLIDAD
jgi:hypothetical protein